MLGASRLGALRLGGASDTVSITGTAASGFGWVIEIAGSLSIPGAAASEFGWATEVAGSINIPGAAASSFGFSTAAVGVSAELVYGVAASSFGWSVEVDGSIDVPGTSAVSFGFSASSAGYVIGGAGASSFGWSTTAAGERSLIIAGVTRDETGAPLGFCDVHLFRTLDDVEVAQTESAADGTFVFSGEIGETYYIVAYLVGSPDVTGATVNTLTASDPPIVGVVAVSFGWSEAASGAQSIIGTAAISFGWSEASNGVNARAVTGTATSSFGWSDVASGNTTGNAAAHVQVIGFANDGAGSTSTVLSVSKTVTAGNTIFVGTSQYIETAPGTDAVTDNLGNVYTAVEPRKSYGNSQVTLYRAPVTIGGALTTITFTHAAADYNTLVADEFARVGTLASVGEATGQSGTSGTWDANKTIPAHGLAVGVLATTQSFAIAAGPTSGSPATALALGANGVDSLPTSLIYAIAGGVNVTGFAGTGTTSAYSDFNGAGGNYNPASAPVNVTGTAASSFGWSEAASGPPTAVTGTAASSFGWTPATAGSTGGGTAYVSSIVDLLAALADNDNTEIVVANGTYAIAEASAQAATSLWIGSDFATRTNAVLVRAATTGSVIFTRGGGPMGAITFTDGAHDQTWQGFVLTNGDATQTGVVVFGGYPNLGEPTNITLHDIAITNVSGDLTAQGVYFSFNAGGGHLIDGLTIAPTGLYSGVHFFHSDVGAPNAHDVICRNLDISGLDTAVMIWEATVDNLTIEDSVFTDNDVAIRYEAGTDILLQNLVSTGSIYGFHSEAFGDTPAEVTFVDCSLG